MYSASIASGSRESSYLCAESVVAEEDPSSQYIGFGELSLRSSISIFVSTV